VREPSNVSENERIESFIVEDTNLNNKLHEDVVIGGDLRFISSENESESRECCVGSVIGGRVGGVIVVGGGTDGGGGGGGSGSVGVVGGGNDGDGGGGVDGIDDGGKFSKSCLIC
jgi:hypothetical protein